MFEVFCLDKYRKIFLGILNYKVVKQNIYTKQKSRIT